MPFESNYELQKRLKIEAAARDEEQAVERARRAGIEQQRANSTYVPPKPRGEMSGAELEAELQEQARRERDEAARAEAVRLPVAYQGRRGYPPPTAKAEKSRLPVWTKKAFSMYGLVAASG